MGGGAAGRQKAKGVDSMAPRVSQRSHATPMRPHFHGLAPIAKCSDLRLDMAAQILGVPLTGAVSPLSSCWSTDGNRGASGTSGKSTGSWAAAEALGNSQAQRSTALES